MNLTVCGLFSKSAFDLQARRRLDKFVLMGDWHRIRPVYVGADDNDEQETAYKKRICPDHRSAISLAKC